MMNYYSWGTHFPIFGFGWIIGVIFWVCFGLLVAMIVKKVIAHGNNAFSDGDNSSGEADSALDILKKRYAKGEISSKEFEKIKKDIKD